MGTYNNRQRLDDAFTLANAFNPDAARINWADARAAANRLYADAIERAAADAAGDTMSAERKPKAGERWLWEGMTVEIVHSEPDTYNRFVVRYFATDDRLIYALAYRSTLKPIKRTVREIVNEADVPLLPNERERLAVAIEMEYPELKQS